MNKKQLAKFIQDTFCTEYLRIRRQPSDKGFRWDVDGWSKSGLIDLRKISKDGFEAELSLSSPIDISFSNLLEVSKKFGTKKVDLDNGGKTAGCPTCDYGACYNFTLQVYEIKKNYPKDL